MSTPPNKFTYPISNIRVIDGDTIEADVDLGFRIRQRQVIRLAGIDAPELRSKDSDEKVRAQISRRALKEVLAEDAWEIRMHSIELDKYGRSLAVIWRHAPEWWDNINTWMVENGHATPMK